MDSLSVCKRKWALRKEQYRRDKSRLAEIGGRIRSADEQREFDEICDRHPGVSFARYETGAPLGDRVCKA